MKTLKGILSLTFAALALTLAAPVLAQAPAPAPGADGASLHGHITNAAGGPITSGDVKGTTQKSADPKDATMAFTLPIDSSGNYAGKQIPPGDYSVFVVVDGKFIDRLEIKLAAGDDKTLDFDMTRADFLAALTPEERKQIEETKKQNESANAANKVINNLNATLAAVRTDLKAPAPNYDKDVADMKTATEAKPEEGVLWMTYGDALSAEADHLGTEDRKSGTSPQSDAKVIQAYSDAVDAYKKGIDLNASSKKPNVTDQAIAYNQMGSALARAGKVMDAQKAYEQGAALMPANAGMYYGNEAAVLYNAAQNNPALNDGTLAAAEKAIAADPKRADPYYIKGQMLLQKASLDPKTQKLVAPDGCVDAYQMYLQLAPDGKYAQSVKEVLAGLNVTVNSKYSAGKKSTK